MDKSNSAKTDPRNIAIEAFDYPLPDERIAKHPLPQRDACKLLVRKADGSVADAVFSALPALLPKDAMLVYNNTRVINARLRFRKSTGALIEVFCLEPASPADYALNFASTTGCIWTCIVGNSKRWKEGPLTLPLIIDGTQVTLKAERVGATDTAWQVAFSWDCPTLSFARIIEAAGEIPIPPYLCRESEEADSTDYQTVYSHIDGSVAAPTAGLHFTPELLEELDRHGVTRREVTLHVGAGTFKPVKSELIGEHPMHSEFIAVPRKLIRELAETTKPVIAVGTTSVRTLESLYHLGCMASTGLEPSAVEQWYPYSEDHPRLTAKEALTALADWLEKNGRETLVASTQIIIAPGYTYRIVKGMVTNFHQPKSTLLLLVSAFIGDDWRALYDHALDADYRFLSYGDACLFLN